jgi:hypothetical protein
MGIFDITLPFRDQPFPIFNKLHSCVHLPIMILQGNSSLCLQLLILNPRDNARKSWEQVKRRSI